LAVDNTDYSRRFPPYGGAEFGSRWDFYKPNAPSIEQRHELVQTVSRCIARHDGVGDLISLCTFAHLLDSDHGVSGSDAKAQQPHDVLAYPIIHEEKTL